MAYFVKTESGGAFTPAKKTSVTAAAKNKTKKIAVDKATIKEFSLFTVFVAAAVLLAASGKGAEFALQGIKLWAAVVLPSLFPYFFVSAILTRLKITERLALTFSPVYRKVFKVSGIVSYAFFLSVISGYPVGAKIVSDLRKNGLLDEDEGVRAAALCSTSSPSFLIAAVGSAAFGSARLGIALTACHIVSAVCTGVIFSFYKSKKSRGSSAAASSVSESKSTEKTGFNGQNSDKNAGGAGKISGGAEKNADGAGKISSGAGGTDNLLYECTYNSVVSILVVGGLIVLFSVLTSLLDFYGVFKPFVAALAEIFGSETLAEGIIYGAFECTGGITRLAAAGVSEGAFAVAAGMCGFGGLSVIAQSLAYLSGAKIKAAPFLLSRVAAAALNFLFALIVYRIFF